MYKNKANNNLFELYVKSYIHYYDLYFENYY